MTRGKPPTQERPSTAAPAPAPLRITVQLGGHTYTEDLEAQAGLSLDPESLNRALAEQPGRFAWWATLEVLARTQRDEYENQLEVLEAALFGKYQEQLNEIAKSDGKKTPTLDAIKAQVTLDIEHQTLKTKLIASERDYGLTQAGRKTMEQKRESMITLAANLRAEMEGQFELRKREVDERMRSGHDPRPAGMKRA